METLREEKKRPSIPLCPFKLSSDDLGWGGLWGTPPYNLGPITSEMGRIRQRGRQEEGSVEGLQGVWEVNRKK